MILRTILVLFLFVLVEVGSINQEGSERVNLTRIKRECSVIIIWQKDEMRRYQERWSWGYADVTRADRSAADDGVKFGNTAEEEWNPCVPIEYPLAPNFNAPGRRVSQVKCYEYMWTMKIIADEAQRNKECADHLLDIIGGEDALPMEFPHMAAIGWKASVGQWVFKCGGSLISNKFVLTAAHCSRASNRDTSITEIVPQIVRLGANKISGTHTNVDLRILRILNHPLYKPPRKYFDIALVELERQVEFTEFIQPACLYTGPDNVLLGHKASLCGWGVLDSDGRTTSTQLQTAEIDVLDSLVCDRLFRRSCSRLWCGMDGSQVCAGNLQGGVDACQGDSGGPLQIKNVFPTGKGQVYRLIGVTSFGIGCAQPNLPGIYTRVSSFIDWIETIVWK